MQKIRAGFILPSAAFTITPKQIHSYMSMDKQPEVGDLVYGRIATLGEHNFLENKEGRIHMITDGSYGIFVYGNRYAPDYYEAFVPEKPEKTVDLLARSGVVGRVDKKHSAVKDPTKVEILGYVVDNEGNVVNTKAHAKARAKSPLEKEKKRAKLILHVGTSMNSGKSTSAIACCWALSALGHSYRASKVTGTASLKDILYMQDAGAEIISDFTHMGFPSTYMLGESEVVDIFENLDAKYANNSRKFWVVEFADGILQRETAMLLRNEYVRSRISKLIFSASDAIGAIGGVRLLGEEFGLVPDAISGRCTSSPLMIQELREKSRIPVFDNIDRDLKQMRAILL